MRSIGIVARQHRLSLRALRFWEEEGLITSARAGPGGQRSYTDIMVMRVELLAKWKAAGIPLVRAKEALEEIDKGNHVGAAIIIDGAAKNLKMRLFNQMTAINRVLEEGIPDNGAPKEKIDGVL